MKAIPSQCKKLAYKTLTFGVTDSRTDGRTDAQPGYIMPPAPKGGGIKIKDDGLVAILDNDWPQIQT